MAQVLRNLISNALRYTPSGGLVSVECRRQGDSNLLSVRDTGKGIDPEDVPYVFDRFYRGEKSRARATGGAGLGLAIVKQLVEAHGGQVWVESTPGQGATFFIRLPHIRKLDKNRPPPGVNLMALERRFQTTCWRRAGSPRTAPAPGSSGARG